MKYSRQTKLKFMQEDFQELVRDKKIVLVGCGGVGSVLGELLVRGGFLNLTLIDNDIIDETNLQRQNFKQMDIGKIKSVALRDVLKEIDGEVDVEIFKDVLCKENIEEICNNSSLIIDATDNFETRRLINTYCEDKEKDWLYNGAVKTEVISCMFYGVDKLFSKVFSKEVKDESCCDVGVLASTTYTSASIAYNKILKYFLNEKDYTLIKLDLWTNKIFEVKIK